MTFCDRDIPVLAMSAAGDGDGDGKKVFSLIRFEDSVRHSPARHRTHRHAFHELIVIEEGAGSYSGDFREYPIAGPAAVIIPAGVVHWWPDHEKLRGVVLGFTLDFLDLPARHGEVTAAFRFPGEPVVTLGAPTLGDLIPWLTRIQAEWSGGAPGRLDLLRSCLTALLLDVRRSQPGTANPVQPPASDRLHQAFLEELEQQVTKMPSPGSLAKALGVSPDHLGATLKAITSRSTSAMIQDRIMLEARRLLAHSRLGVAETGHALGFESASYFTRYFRRHAGVSPKEFRDAPEA